MISLRDIWYWRIFDTTRFHLLRREFGNREFTCLDVGAGHSAATFSKRSPNCVYFGIDIITDYDPEELALMSQYWAMDLTDLKFDPIPDECFDAISLTHVIEHLHKGDEVVSTIQSKLKKGGVIYIEYPGIRSTRLPRMKKWNTTLNFYDDPTHTRVFTLQEVQKLLTDEGFEILKRGTRRRWIYILLVMPLAVVRSLILRKPIRGSVFWDLFGFAEFVFARKI